MPQEVLCTGLSGMIGTRFRELNGDLALVDISRRNGFDILDPRSLSAAFQKFRGNTVVHFAAFTDTNAAWKQQGDKTGDCYRLNVEGTQNIARLCHSNGFNLVHVSTDYIFDGKKEEPYVEDDKPNPLEWYGLTKLMAEDIVLNSGTPTSVIRVASPYQANYPSKPDIIRKMLGNLQQGKPCNLFSDQISTPTFTDDIGIGLRKVADSFQPGIYHLVGSSRQTIFRAGQEVVRIFGYDESLIKPSSLQEYLSQPSARPYAVNSALSNQKFISEFGYTPKTLTGGLVEMKQQLDCLPSLRN